MPIVKDPVTGELKVVPDASAAFVVPTATPEVAKVAEIAKQAEAENPTPKQPMRKEYLQKRIAELLAKHGGMESNIPVRGEDSIYWHLLNELRGL